METKRALALRPCLLLSQPWDYKVPHGKADSFFSKHDECPKEGRSASLSDLRFSYILHSSGQGRPNPVTESIFA